MRRALQKVTLDTGNRWAYYALAAWLGFVIGWVMHPECAMWFA